MKKTIAVVLLVVCLISLGTVVFGVDINSQATEIKNAMEEHKEEYIEKYGSEEYWFGGYILEEYVQPYSIPLCFAGIVVGLVFQYVMGTRRLDYKHRGYGMVIAFVTLLIVCQVLPFIYALIVVGWRG